MSEPEWSLHYFDGYGRAEAHRMLLNHAGIPFTDVRLSFADWGAQKDSGKYLPGGLPQLETMATGEMRGDGRALLRYLANKYGYTYKDPIAAQLSDSLVDGFYDIFNNPANIAMFAKEEDKPKL